MPALERSATGSHFSHLLRLLGHFMQWGSVHRRQVPVLESWWKGEHSKQVLLPSSAYLQCSQLVSFSELACWQEAQVPSSPGRKPGLHLVHIFLPLAASHAKQLASVELHASQVVPVRANPSLHFWHPSSENRHLQQPSVLHWSHFLSTNDIVSSPTLGNPLKIPVSETKTM